MNHIPGLLAGLPHELLLYQLSFFHDISSHLALSITCRRIHALYDESLWRRISISSGLGKPFDLVSRGLPWRRLCVNSIVHVKACKLPDCSEVNLSRGRDRGLLQPQRNMVLSRQRVQSEEIELYLNPNFEGLAGDLEDLYSVSLPCDLEPKPWWFKRWFQKSTPQDNLLDSIAMRAPHAGEQMVTKLTHHLPASCALATFPAVDVLEIDFGQETMQVRNPDGVCVWDVVSALAKKMLEVIPSDSEGGKAPKRIYQAIASEWQQYVLLQFSLYGRGSINLHLDLGAEVFENHVDPNLP